MNSIKIQDNQPIPGKVKKVLLVGPVSPPFGGIATYVEQLSTSQIENIEFSIFNTSFPKWVAPLDREGKRSYFSIFEGGVISGLNKVIFVISSYFRFFFVIVCRKPDIVQIFPASYWAYWRNWLYLLQAKLLGKKTIFHVLNAIDVFYEEVGKTQRRMIKNSLSLPDYVLVQSPQLQSYVEKLTDTKVKGILNGIHLDDIPQAQVRKTTLTDAHDFVGSTIGNLSKNKGTYLILDALRILKSEGIQVNWIFIGRGDIKNFSELAKDNEIEQQVVFTGPVSEETKWKYLLASDFYCLPSYAEGQPISIIEAMAIGLPIISTTIGSIPEIVCDNENGYLINVGDSLALSEAIKKIVNDPKHTRFMGESNESLCKEKFDANTMFKAISTIYDDLIQS